jgi:hypothetical protein
MRFVGRATERSTNAEIMRQLRIPQTDVAESMTWRAETGFQKYLKISIKIKKDFQEYL